MKAITIPKTLIFENRNLGRFDQNRVRLRRYLANFFVETGDLDSQPICGSTFGTNRFYDGKENHIGTSRV